MCNGEPSTPHHGLRPAQFPLVPERIHRGWASLKLLLFPPREFSAIFILLFFSSYARTNRSTASMKIFYAAKVKDEIGNNLKD